MKTVIRLLTVVVFAAAVFAISCTNEEALKPVNPAAVQMHKTVGIVKGVDPDAAKVTIDHEDIPGYMVSMEMTEKVSDPKLIDGLKEGDKVEFEFQRNGAVLTITKLKKIGEVAVTNGGEIYKTSCAECHGGAGEGAPKGISLITGHALNHSEKEHIARVTNGKDKKMPAFKDKLSAEQIAAVVKYVRDGLQKDFPEAERMKHNH